MTDNDRTAILQLVHDYCDVIHDGDEAAFRALWLDRADDTVISITHDYHGIDAVAGEFLGKLRELYTSITLVEDEEPQVRPLADDVAIVVFRYHTETVRRETGDPDGIEGIETQVVRRTPGGWRLAHIHYSKKG